MKINIVVFDMDGVLVDVRSSWQLVHEAFNATNQESVKRYLNCEISYAELMRRDIVLWGKIHIDEVKRILSKAPLMKGADLTISALRESGYKTAIISAGISVFADRLREELGLDYAYANRILTDKDGMTTGEGEEVVSLLDKIKVLRKLASIEKTDTLHCVVVGDTIYDIPLFREAGLSIAFNADSNRVKEAADVAIEDKDLTRILPYLVKPNAK